MKYNLCITIYSLFYNNDGKLLPCDMDDKGDLVDSTILKDYDAYEVAFKIANQKITDISIEYMPKYTTTSYLNQDDDNMMSITIDDQTISYGMTKKEVENILGKGEYNTKIKKVRTIIQME